MLSRLLSRATAGLALVALMPLALAQEPQELSPVEAGKWLSRIHKAAGQRNYQGTLVVSVGGAVTSSRVAHYCDGPNQFERIEALDGQPRRVFRHNDRVLALWPKRGVAVVEQRDPLSPFPALLRGGDDRLTEHYSLLAQGTDRVAGHDTEVLVVRPRDGHRFGQRLWAERRTGLLLRADIVGAQGELLESTSFSEIEIGVRAQPESVLQPMRKLDGYHVSRPSHVRTDLGSEGWSLVAPVAGFRQISCVRRPLPVAAPDSGGDVDVVQAIFSDGLTHVSLFIEPFDARRHRREMHTAVGATHTLMGRHGDSWITVVGDVPVPTLRMFAAALERRR